MISTHDFTRHLRQLVPDASDKHFLLAVSGGIDSMTMLFLFRETGLRFSVAHYNYQLRGDDSQRDEALVRDVAQQYHVPFYSICFDTRQFIEENKLNLQDAARTLRYNWFRSLAEEHGFSYVCTAHHADDAAETFLMGASRGKALNYLVGIRQKDGLWLRPMLHMTRSNIEAFASAHGIIYREDLSNTSDDYLRNRLRHKVMPVLNGVMPGFALRISALSKHLDRQDQFLRAMLDQQLSACSLGNDSWDLVAVRNNEFADLLLVHLALQCGLPPETGENIFEQRNDAIPHVYFGTTASLRIHRGIIRLERQTSFAMNSSDIVAEIYPDGRGQDIISIDEVEIHEQHQIEACERTIYISADAIEFPMIIRSIREGDWFIPFGQKGRKKIFKYLHDHKATLWEKESAMVLCSGSNIVWLVGYRMDERYRISGFPSRAFRIRWRS